MIKSNSRVKTVCTFIIAFIVINILAIQCRVTQDDKTSLWKIKSDSNSVYILGSIHLLTEEEYPLNEKIENVFSGTNNIVFEANLDSAQNPDFQNFVLAKARYSDNHSLKTELSAVIYEKLKNKLKTIGLDIDSLNPFRPWFVSTILSMRKLILLGFNPNLGVDKYFFQKAKSAGKNIYELESTRYQIELFSTLSREDEETALLETIEEYDSIGVMLNPILISWRKGDLIGLDRTLNKEISKYPQIYDNLLVKRNYQWVKRIKEFLKQKQNYFIIVSAGHLPGERGLINLLDNEGYKITQF